MEITLNGDYVTVCFTDMPDGSDRVKASEAEAKKFLSSKMGDRWDFDTDFEPTDIGDCYVFKIYVDPY